MCGSRPERLVSRELLLAQVDQVSTDVLRLLLFHETLIRALGWGPAPSETGMPAMQALQETLDEADSPALRPDRWPDGGLSEVWVREQLDEVTESLRRLHTRAAAPLLAKLQDC
jgi:hypothetical protein